jgi:tRNA(fMet)-specific endonuclease VapC
MGLILDTSILIAGERRRDTVDQLLSRVQAAYGETEIGLSTITIIELTHGIYRAKTDEQRKHRLEFAEDLLNSVATYPVSLEIAQLAGRIEGEQAALGILIAFEDLVIGTTALYLGFDVATLNAKHFQLIPGLKIVTL